jgi:hypothetical protein
MEDPALFMASGDRPTKLAPARLKITLYRKNGKTHKIAGLSAHVGT